MFRCSGIFFLGLYMTSSIFLNVAAAQQVRQDQAAIATMQAAVAAMGGVQSASSMSTAVLSGHTTFYGGDQASIKQSLTKYSVVNGSVAFRRELAGNQGTSVFASGGKSPVYQSPNQKEHRFGKHVAMAGQILDIPILALWRDLSNPKYQLVFINEGAGSLLHVQLEDTTDPAMRELTRQDWYFNSATRLPIRVTYNLPDVITPSINVKAMCDYLQFRSFDGIIIPVQMKIYEMDQLFAISTTDSIRVNSGVEQGFDMPED